MIFEPRWMREGWNPIDTAPNDRKVRASHWSGERCDWEHDAWKNEHGHWVYDLGGLIPTHWRETGKDGR